MVVRLYCIASASASDLISMPSPAAEIGPPILDDKTEARATPPAFLIVAECSMPYGRHISHALVHARSLSRRPVTPP
jgi:hypothetical protein